MPERTPTPDPLPWQMDVVGEQKEALAMAQQESSIAECAAQLFDCTIITTKKLADRFPVGYLVRTNFSCHAFWIWGADRPMNLTDVENHFMAQMVDNLVIGSS